MEALWFTRQPRPRPRTRRGHGRSGTRSLELTAGTGDMPAAARRCSREDPRRSTSSTGRSGVHVPAPLGRGRHGQRLRRAARRPPRLPRRVRDRPLARRCTPRRLDALVLETSEPAQADELPPAGRPHDVEALRPPPPGRDRAARPAGTLPSQPSALAALRPSVEVGRPARPPCAATVARDAPAVERAARRGRGSRRRRRAAPRGAVQLLDDVERDVRDGDVGRRQRVGERVGEARRRPRRRSRPRSRASPRRPRRRCRAR